MKSVYIKALLLSIGILVFSLAGFLADLQNCDLPDVRQRSAGRPECGHAIRRGWSGVRERRCKSSRLLPRLAALILSVPTLLLCPERPRSGERRRSFAPVDDGSIEVALPGGIQSDCDRLVPILGQPGHAFIIVMLRPKM